MTSRAMLAATALVVLITGCTAPDDEVRADGPVVGPGETVPVAFSREVHGYPVTMMLPRRRYNLTVTRGLPEIDYASASNAGVAQEAPEGHVFVGVAWSVEPALGDGWLMTEFKDTPATVTLEVDDEEFEVGDLTADVDGGGWVAVPSDAEEVDLEVEYGGLTQRAGDVWSLLGSDVNGPSALYDQAPHFTDHFVDSPLRRPESDPEFWVGGDVMVRVGTALPWMNELGWAPPGKGWLPVSVQADTAQAGYGTTAYTSYEVNALDPVVRFQGTKPHDTLPYDGQEGEDEDGTWRGVAVFLVEKDYVGGDEIQVRRTHLATVEGDAAPGAPRLLRRTAVVRIEAPGY